MAQTTTGLRRILSIPGAYDALQNMVGAAHSRRQICSDYIRAKRGDVVVDVGCGTAAIIDHLPHGVRYYGFDLSLAYIAEATKRYGSRGVFICNDIVTLSADEVPPCNVAIAIGLLHHLDDVDATRLLAALHERLAPSGRLITVDPAYYSDQSRFARMIISRDRGRNVRSGAAYKALVPVTYSQATLIRRDDLLNIPYTHAVMECSK